MTVGLPPFLQFENDDLSVLWIGGAVVLRVGDDVVVVDVPAGLTQTLCDRGLVKRIRTVLVSTGGVASIGGLLPLLHEVARHQSPEFPFVLCGPMGDERVGLMAELWSRGWPDQLTIGVDALVPGTTCEVGSLMARTVGLEMGEPVWQPEQTVRAVTGLGWRFEMGKTAIVWLKSCAPSPYLARLCRGATLAILEVGVQPWPSSDRQWRLSSTDASQIGLLAQELWLVGDQGGPLQGGLLT
jgi:hypothetical protein